MKLKTIRKNKKKNILIGGLIVLLLISVVTHTTTRAKYKSVQSVRLATGRVNFKGADMSLIAINVSEDGINYTSSTTPPEGRYELNTERSKCRIPTATLIGENAPEDPNVSIEYTNNKINILGLTTKNTKCYVYLDKVNIQTIDTIIADIENRKDGSYKGTTMPTFTSAAIESETKTNNGIFKTSDLMYGGDTYYWRGATTTNYVMFANKCWRIIRINGDKTMRLIYDGTTCHANGENGQKDTDSIAKNIQYNTSDTQSNYVGWTYIGTSQRTISGTSSNIKKIAEEWFTDISNFTIAQQEKVAEGKFCNDRNVHSGSSWAINGSSPFNYAAYRVSDGTKKPILSCSSLDIYTLQVGIITADEAQFAGASGVTTNKQYYLFSGKDYWTMSPFWWNGNGSVCVYVVNSSGALNNSFGTVSSFKGLRPVINIKNDITFNSGGNGTIDNPYVVQENS